jgi:hypothetical protein
LPIRERDHFESDRGTRRANGYAEIGFRSSVISVCGKLQVMYPFFGSRQS